MRTGKDKERKVKQKKRQEESVLEILSINQYDTKNHCYEMASREYAYMDMLRIRTKDRTGMDQEDITFDNISWQRFYLMYTEDIKIIALNFPVDTKVQREYYSRRIAKTKNPVYQKWLNKELAIYNNISVYKTNREFFLMIFAESIKQLNENLAVIDQTLGIGTQGNVDYLSQNEKDILLRILNNKCTMTRRNKE
ncbi:hypothetical protein ABXS75_10860 [Roseburia hominis]